MSVSLFASISLTPKSPEGEVGADDRCNKVDLILEELCDWGNLVFLWAEASLCPSGRYTSSLKGTLRKDNPEK